MYETVLTCEKCGQPMADFTAELVGNGVRWVPVPTPASVPAAPTICGACWVAGELSADDRKALEAKATP